MKYQTLGRTGLKVSEVSIGTEWLEKKSPELITSVMRKAIENGVNYFDIIFNFEEYLTKVSKAIEGHREKIILVHHLGSSEYKGKYKKDRSIKSCTNTFEKYLEIMGTDYVDILFVHFVLGPTNFEEKILKPNGPLDLALKFKAEGKAKFIGISTHSLGVVEKAAKNGNFDVIMYQVNLANNALPNRNEVLALCAQENIGVVSMKPYAGGILFRKNAKVGLGGYRTGGMNLEKKTIPEMVTPVKCLHYILSQVGVSTVVPGVASIEELDATLAYCTATEEEKDYSMLLKEFNEYITGECVYCNHCQPCPADIDIGRVFKVFDQARIELTEEIKAKYNEFEVNASDCTECGECEERCPFDVEVINKMVETVKLFQ
ncbi:MAG: aldo/keto reductase [Candidatus Hodarchaeales archaeon]